MNEAETRAEHEAENSDLFDVLAYVAFAANPESRTTRAAPASPLLKLRSKNALADAVKDLDSPEQIRGVFVGFQGYR